MTKTFHRARPVSPLSQRRRRARYACMRRTTYTLPALLFAPAATLAASAYSGAAVDSHLEARAKIFFHDAQTGEFNRAELTAKANAALTPAMARSIVKLL